MQLQMAYRSAVYFSIGAIGTNGTNQQVVYARPSVVNICSLQMVYQSTNYFFHWNRFVPMVPMAPIDKATLTNSDHLPMVRLVRVFWRLVSVCVYWTCVRSFANYHMYSTSFLSYFSWCWLLPDILLYVLSVAANCQMYDFLSKINICLKCSFATWYVLILSGN